MITILSAEHIRAWDEYTIANEPIESIDLMERAAMSFCDKFRKLVDSKSKVAVICGPGNNGGDGFAAARLLEQSGYSVVCYEIKNDGFSPECAINRDRFLKEEKVLKVQDHLTVEVQGDVIIDAIFGSGLNRPVTSGIFQETIEWINRSGKKVISIDIPSGLFADQVELSGAIVKANDTITFEVPKLSFLVPETGRWVGQFHTVSIGLHQDYLEGVDSKFHMIQESDVSELLKKREKFSHKGTYGRAQIFAGSHGKMGAAHLCGRASMRVGVGLLTMNIPGGGNEIIQTSLPEAMTIPDEASDYITDFELLDKTDVVCIGPGIGTDQATQKGLLSLLEKGDARPMVLDADALNIIAANPGATDLIPKGSVLTPHAVEFERLFGQNENSLDKIELMRSFSQKTGVIVVSKGPHTVISDEEGKIYFNSSGNPGMATAGSGDVLAGMITGFLAQGLKSSAAAIAGVFLHGQAGDSAAKKVGELSLMASDLLDKVPEAISNVQNADFI